MNIVILDESRKRMAQIADVLEQKGNSVKSFYRSGDFMEALADFIPDTLLINADAWLRGRVIFNYFNFNKKIARYPIVFYNAPEHFAGMSDRTIYQNVKILKKKTDIDAIVEAI